MNGPRFVTCQRLLILLLFLMCRPRVFVRSFSRLPEKGIIISMRAAAGAALLLTSQTHASGTRRNSDTLMAPSQNARSLPMALAESGAVQREHTCLVDSASSCPGLAELNERNWLLGVPPSANLLLYGPSYMSEIVSSIVAFNAEELTSSSSAEEQQSHERECNVPGSGSSACLRACLRGSQAGACVYTFRNGARLTAVTNSEALQDEGSQPARQAFGSLLRRGNFSHVFFMMPHGQEYWVESRTAESEHRKNDATKINDSRGRNMCLTAGAGTEDDWDEYSSCVSASANWRTAQRLMAHDRLTLVVPWMQAVPAGSRFSGHPVLSTAETAIGRGCAICDPDNSVGCPTLSPIYGHLSHQCVVVCERGQTLDASLAERRPTGPCLAGTVPVMAERLLAAASPELARVVVPAPAQSG